MAKIVVISMIYRPFPITEAEPNSMRKCQRCRHFHQSGMQKGATIIGYCFKWTWQHDEWVIVREEEVCLKFFWRAPPSFNVFRIFLTLLELSLLGYYGHTGFKTFPDEISKVDDIEETQESNRNSYNSDRTVRCIRGLHSGACVQRGCGAVEIGVKPFDIRFRDMNQEQEEAFIRAFIVSEKRERYSQLLANPKRRAKILGAMYHNLDIIPARMLPISNADHSVETVERLLRQRGAGQTCYLISPNGDIDQCEMPLREAISKLISEDGVAVACCIPGRLAYYKAEWEQYLLEYKP